MARKALGPSTLVVVQALDALVPGPWVVACSGGADSLALAWAAAHVGRRRGTSVRAVVVDHGLQEGSDAVASGVVATLGAFGLEAAVVRVEVTDGGAGPEASAREARYAALEAARGAGERVLLGHTLDDQAETVLLGLARGSGARSLAGMASERGVFVRPLLGVGREVTRGLCDDVGLVAWQDPHNADARYARVRVRERVLPVLERELGPGVREALARTAALSRRDADALDALAASAVADLADASAPLPTSLSSRWLRGLEPAIRSRVLRRWLIERGASEVAAAHVEAVEQLVTRWRGQRDIHLPGLAVSVIDGTLHSSN